MSQVTILGVSQETLLKNTQSALEGFQNGQPVQKKALIRKALATFLGQKMNIYPALNFLTAMPTLKND